MRATRREHAFRPFACQPSGILLSAALVAAWASAGGIARGQELLLTFEAPNAGEFFGHTIANGGDMDGDGTADIAISSLFFGPPTTPELGRVTLYTTPSGSQFGEVRGEAAFDRLGGALHRLDDIDGDGRSELVVGAAGRDSPDGPDTGRVYVYSGGDGPTLAILNGENRDDFFGIAVAGLTDADADGTADILVGALGHTSSRGRVYLYSGADDSLVYSLDGEGTEDAFGDTLTPCGDLDGDGLSDFVVGAFGFDGPLGADTGKIYVYSGVSGELLWSEVGEAPFDLFGGALACNPDMNGDGVPEVLAGAEQHDGPAGIDAGRAYVLSGVDGAFLGTVDGESAGDRFGFSISGLGDLNLDGRGDFAVGAYLHDGPAGSDSGRAYAFSGATRGLLCAWDGSAAGDLLGYSVGAGGDVDGDGDLDVLVGAPGGGVGGQAFAFGCNPLPSEVTASGSCLATCPGPQVVYRIVGENNSGFEATLLADVVGPIRARVLEMQVPPGPFAFDKAFQFPDTVPPEEECPDVLTVEVSLFDLGGNRTIGAFDVEVQTLN